jgi:hypothetical protein
LPHLWPTGSSRGRPLDYGPVLLRKPFRPHLTMDALPSAVVLRWLQVYLGCIRLSLSCPFRSLHTFLLRPARHYPRLWIWSPSSGDQRDFNPPDQCAARRTLWVALIPRSPSRTFVSSVRDFRQCIGVLRYRKATDCHASRTRISLVSRDPLTRPLSSTKEAGPPRFLGESFVPMPCPTTPAESSHQAYSMIRCWRPELH